MPAGCARVQDDRTVKTPDEMQAKVVDRAAEDTDFRARLRNGPKEAVEQELDVTVPAPLSIEVHEEDGTTVHLVVPPDSKLSESDLQAVTGDVGSEDRRGFLARSW